MASIASSDVYSSLPLRNRSIRLLELKAASAVSDDGTETGLSAALKVVDLTQCPNFKALSYVWGTPHSRVINCNGIALSITINCHDALMALRKMFGRLTIWVDAICINQNDTDERNNQVLLMGEIYSWAEDVYIWLGKANAGSDAAIDFFSLTPSMIQCLQPIHLTATLNRNTIWRETWTILKRELWYLLCLPFWILQVHGKSIRRFTNAYKVDDLNDLLDRDYISRMWTFQEVILACNPVIVCGEKILLWDTFMRGMEALLTFKHQLDEEIGTNGGGEFYKSPTGAAWRSILTLWMHMGRTSRWHDQQRRKSLRSKGSSTRDGKSSFYIYKTRAVKILNLIRIPLIAIVLLGIGGWVTGWCLFIIYTYPEDRAVSQTSQVEFGFGLTILIGSAFFSLFAFSGLLGIIQDMRLGSRSDHFPIYITPGEQLIDKVDRGPNHSRESAAFHRLRESDTPNMDSTIVAAIHRVVRDRGATDPKDKLYALLGVLENLKAEIPEVSYAKSIAEIYSELFMVLVRWGKIRNAILDAGLPTISDAPSWVPDWEHVNRWIDEPLYIYRQTAEKPTAPAAQEWTVEGNGTVLKVRGCRRGVVDFCSNRFLERTDTDASTELVNLGIFLNTFRAMRWATAPYEENYTISDVLYEIIYARIRSRIDAAERRKFIEWYQILRRAISTRNDAETQAQACLDELAQNPQMLSYHKTLCDEMAGSGRVFFTTNNGYAGTGTKYILSGDHIAFIMGVCMPLIIRKPEEDTERYQVVGPSFIHGQMQSKIWNWEGVEEDLDLI